MQYGYPEDEVRLGYLKGFDPEINYFIKRQEENKITSLKITHTESGNSICLWLNETEFPKTSMIDSDEF